MRRRVVVFALGSERFAVEASAIDHVVERAVPRPLAAMPDHIAGVVRHRDEWVPAVEAAAALGIEGGDGPRPALILRRGPLRYALLVDATEGARDIDADHMRSLSGGGERAHRPDPRAGGSGETLVARDPDGLMTLVRPDELFESDVLSDAEEPAMTPMENAAAATPVVVFRLAGIAYGIDAGRVAEVLAYEEEPRPLAGVPEFIEGTCDVRGDAVPVIGLRRRFGLDTAPRAGERAVILIRLDDAPIGLLIDAVEDVERLPPDAVSELPAYLRGPAADYLRGLGRVDDRLLLLLRPDRLLTPEQRRALERAEPPAADGPAGTGSQAGGTDPDRNGGDGGARPDD